MSKYAKVEDVYEAVGRAFVKDELADREVTLVTDELADLPTIEVSEDAISREWVLEKMLAEAEHYNDEVKHGYHNCELIVYDAPSVMRGNKE